MAKEYIEREAAKARLRMWITDCVLAGDNDEADCYRDCIDLLDSIPAADVVEVRHGRWEFGKDLPDSFGHEGLDTDEIVRQKMAYNRGRPYKHGKRC